MTCVSMWLWEWRQTRVYTVLAVSTFCVRIPHLPAVGCMTFDLSHANLLVTGLHEIGHVLGFAAEVWHRFGYYQNPLGGDTHFTGPLAIAAFDDAGGLNYEDAKVPLQEGEFALEGFCS